MSETPDLSAKIRQWLISGYVGVAFTAAMLFIPAWRLDWVMGWVYVALWLLWHTATALVLIPTDPELIAERTGPKKGIKDWDTMLISVVGLATLAQGVVAGLDVRFGWTRQLWPQVRPEVVLVPQIVASVVATAGRALGVWAMAANSFFSKVVRIQRDRGQTVVTGGPYRTVRHPGYVGEIIFNLSAPVMLGSVWTCIPTTIVLVLYVVRTALEDRTLREELEGYAAYARSVRYRLLPGVW